MARPRSLLVVALLSGLLASAQPTPQNGELQPMKGAIHPDQRTVASPDGGAIVAVNPPPLLWPSSSADASYAVRLSQDPAFPADSTIAGSGVKWAMFNAHQTLTAGTWYWQFCPETGKEKGKWSPVCEFRVEDGTRQMPTPPAGELVARCPQTHPRVLIKADGWDAFRERVGSDPEAEKIVRAAKKVVGAEPYAESTGVPAREGKNAFQQRTLERWASKGLGGRVLGRVKVLCEAYVITGDETYAREAIRHGLSVAQFDPDGVTSMRVSDFGDGSCLRALAYTYDTCYGLLTDEEKAVLLKAIQARGARLFGKYRNNLETRNFNAHVWQHILHQFTDAAFAVAHDLPEAGEWVAYIYELWLNRVPLMGGDDGGWANGNSYFGTNLQTLIYVPAFFQDLLGLDLLDQPWYRNTIYYQIYTWPPNSKCDGFGDGGEKAGGPSGTPGEPRFAFVDILARHFNDPYGAWYVDRCFEAIDKRDFSETSMAWYRLRFGDAMPNVAPAGRFDLPLARDFRDIGVVAMHTDLNQVDRNLMVAFRSSPFGSFNHAHADQNSFNVFFGGKRLSANSGYYITYGDPHFTGWYTHTIGHNSVLIDGKGQAQKTTDAFGWIPRFLNGRTLAYCVGDASNAYPETGLTRFRRHMVLLRPRTVVIYDELEADHPAEWTWLLHADKELHQTQSGLTLQTPEANALAQLRASTGFAWSIDSVFDPPADNWHGKKKGDEVIQYPDQWHARAATNKKTPKARFLGILQLADAGRQPTVPEETAPGTVSVDGWSISAEMDENKPAALLIRHRNGQSALAMGRESLELSGKTYRTDTPDATWMVESNGAEMTVKQACDELPAAAR